MKFSEAISILEMEETNEVDDGLASAYRAAMKKYHPDVTELDIDFALEMSKLVNEAYSFLAQNIGKWSVGDKGSTNIAGMMAEIYNSIKHIPHIKMERLGVWMWVTIGIPTEFMDSQADTVESRLKRRAGLKQFRQGVGAQLKEHGFRYAPKKQKWSWHDVGDGPKKWRKGAWDWNRIKSTFDHEELNSQPLRAVG